MRMPSRFSLALSAMMLLPVSGALAQNANPATYQQVKYSTEQLDNLVASIALYPDPILAQVLVAATFPDQIELAVKYVRAHGTNGIDDQPWDVSVRSVAHYAPVLNLLGERPDWTAALGQAYAVQSSDVMESVQHLRQMANAQGNLVSTPEQKVIVDRDNIRIEPAQTRVIYVPTYDPTVVYYEPVFYSLAYRRSYFTFGVGFPIGTWLMYDCDWYGRSIYYDDWSYGYGWRYRARPFISVNFVYLQPRYHTVYVNRSVVYHNVDYRNLDRYNTVHRGTNWNDHRVGDSRGLADRDRHDDGRAGNSNNNGVNNGSNGRNDGRAGGNDGRTQNNGGSNGRNDGRAGGTDGRTQTNDGRTGNRAQYPVNVSTPRNSTTTTRVPVEREPARTADPRRTGSGVIVMPQSGRPETGRAQPSRESAPPRASTPSRERSSSPPPKASAPPKGGSSSGPSKGSSSSRGSDKGKKG